MGASVHHKWKPTTTVPCHSLLSIICSLCMDSLDASTCATSCFSLSTRSPNLFCDCPANGEGATFHVLGVRLGKSIGFFFSKKCFLIIFPFDVSYYKAHALMPHCYLWPVLILWLNNNREVSLQFPKMHANPRIPKCFTVSSIKMVEEESHSR